MAAKKKARKKKSATAELRAYALAFPGAWEDSPWGERVAKVGKKVFAFMGKPSGGGFGISVKLPRSHQEALAKKFCSPTGYGLGRSGWVSASFAKESDVPVDLIKEWIDESYRAVAPKKLIKELVAEAKA